MPTLVSKVLTNANITDSNNFLSVITTTNALQTAGTTTAALGTTFVATPTSFVGAGETLTAIGLEVGAVGVLTGVTITIRLRNTTDGINTDYTYDATLLTTGGRGWNFFSLGAGQVLTSGKSWQIQVAASVASRVSLLRTVTAGDWNRIFVTNTDATFATGDTLYLGGRLLTTGSIDNTSMVVNASLSLANLFINNGASLSWTANSLTMTLSGSLFVFPGSAFTVGTSVSPVAGLIEFANTTAGQNAFSVFGPCTFNIYGSDVSTNYNIDLASTANSGQANAVLVSAPDWVNGQLVAYSSSRGATASELRTVSSVSGTTVTSTTNFSNIHDVRTLGTYSPIQDTAKACLLNRGFTVANTSASTGTWFGSVYGPVICNWDTVFFRDMGANVAASGLVPSKYGWVIDITTGGSFICDNCSFYPAAAANASAMTSEASTTRLGTDYTITNCVYLSRSTTASNFFARNGAAGANTIITGCIMMGTTANNSAMIFVRTTNSANITIDGCYSYGPYYLVNRTEAVSGPIGTVTIDNCFTVGFGFYNVSNIYSATSFSLGNTTISNCIAINRLGTPVNAAFALTGLISITHTVSSCTFIGFNRYYYGAHTVDGGFVFDNCVFEDDTVASQISILLGANARPLVSFKNCYFSTTFTNQSFITLNWANIALYSGGNFNFKDCSFNGDGSLFVTSTSLKYFAGFAAVLDNCFFRGSSTTLSRNFVKMGSATVSADTFSGTGSSIELTPYSINEATYPYRYQFLLPTTATNFTVNFKTKSYSLNGTVKAYVENAFGVVAQSTLTVSSNWDSQSIVVSTGGAYTELLNLTIELTGVSGYLVVDDITVGSTSGILGEGGKYAFLDTSGSAISETSHLFC